MAGNRKVDFSSVFSTESLGFEAVNLSVGMC